MVMKHNGFGYGLMVLAFVALLLQSIVPHHHHQQALLLFTQSCPTTTEASHPPHDADNDCDQSHSEDTQCNALDHVFAAGSKQQGSRGVLNFDLLPLLATALIVQFGIFISKDLPVAFPDVPPGYISIGLHAHSLRGPPATA